MNSDAPRVPYWDTVVGTAPDFYSYGPRWEDRAGRSVMSCPPERATMWSVYRWVNEMWLFVDDYGTQAEARAAAEQLAR